MHWLIFQIATGFLLIGTAAGYAICSMVHQAGTQPTTQDNLIMGLSAFIGLGLILSLKAPKE